LVAIISAETVVVLTPIARCFTGLSLPHPPKQKRALVCLFVYLEDNTSILSLHYVCCLLSFAPHMQYALQEAVLLYHTMPCYDLP
jgi:hypothetical protein